MRNVRLVLSALYVLLFLTFVVLMPGCGTGDVRTTSAASVTTKPTSLVVVDTWMRDDYKATGMDIMVHVKGTDVGVDSVVVQYHDEHHVTRYSDMCVVWVRTEDNTTIHWGSDAKGTALHCYPPTVGEVLTRGTWVARVYFNGMVPPMPSGCVCTERSLSSNK